MEENVKGKLYLYPLWLRIWHWINAVLYLILIFTGISLQFSNPDQPLLMRFDLAILWHNVPSVILCVSYLFFIIGSFLSGNIKFYYFKFKRLPGNVLSQMKFYAFGMLKGKKTPFPISNERKFNPLQKITYVIAMFIAFPIIIITGLALFYPDIVIHNVLGTGGIFLTALLHSAIGFLLSMFMIIHIYFCTLGLTIWSDFKAMIDGWHTPHE